MRVVGAKQMSEQIPGSIGYFGMVGELGGGELDDIEPHNALDTVKCSQLCLRHIGMMIAADAEELSS